MTNPAPKPCPFCGARSEIKQSNIRPWYCWIQCSKCDAEMIGPNHTAVDSPLALDLITAWNRADRSELLAAILDFCEQSEWAADTWKAQPHIARLFEIAKIDDGAALVGSDQAAGGPSAPESKEGKAKP